MVKYIEPINTCIDLKNNRLVPEGEKMVRRLSDMAEMYQDKNAVEKILKENPVIYEFSTVMVPEDASNLLHCISIVYPGKIGNEYYMTKGHFHEIIDTAEIYLTMKGQGQLILETPDGDTNVLEMKEGMISYIPPRWAHRTVNTGEEPFVFFGVYRADAGHNYGTIEEKGMAKLVMERNGELLIEDNPNY